MGRDEEDDPREVERGSMDHSIEQLKEVYADDGDEEGNVEFAGGLKLNVEDAGDYVLVEPEDGGETEHDESNGSPEEGVNPEEEFNPEEENWEVEDMPGDNADEREAAHDNKDWDAADG